MIGLVAVLAALMAIYFFLLLLLHFVSDETAFNIERARLRFYNGLLFPFSLFVLLPAVLISVSYSFRPMSEAVYLSEQLRGGLLLFAISVVSAVIINELLNLSAKMYTKEQFRH